MTPAQFRAEVANAFDGRSRNALESALRRFTDPAMHGWTIEQLQQRINFLHVQLAATNDHMQRARHKQTRERVAAIQAEIDREELERARNPDRLATGSNLPKIVYRVLDDDSAPEA